MLSYFQAVLVGGLQGVTELFPISSLGHSILLPPLLGWQINQTDPFFLVFLVATHAATALVLFLFFWKDWQRIILGFFRSLQAREIRSDDHDAKLAWLLVISTVPAGILGLLFEDTFKKLFGAPQLVAGVLFLNGLLLLAAELLRRHRKETAREQTPTGSNERLAKLSWWGAVKVGCFQCLALMPGFSRTGSTLTGGLLTDLSHEDAARFSFLLATPIIGAAAALKLPELASQTGIAAIGPTLVGAVSAGFFAYLSVKFLTKYFETKNLTVFAIYCLAVGGGLFVWFTLGK